MKKQYFKYFSADSIKIVEENINKEIESGSEVKIITPYLGYRYNGGCATDGLFVLFEKQERTENHEQVCW
jgi:hypothetical protein